MRCLRDNDALIYLVASMLVLCSCGQGNIARAAVDQKIKPGDFTASVQRPADKVTVELVRDTLNANIRSATGPAMALCRYSIGQTQR